MPPMRRGSRGASAVRTLAAAAAFLGALVGPLAGAAVAHAALEETTPGNDEVVRSAPRSVTLRFDEPVEAGPGGVRVLATGGERVDKGRVNVSDGGRVVVAPFDGSRPGTYTVAWRAVSKDSHPLKGSFVFHVRTRTGAARISDADDSVARAIGGAGRWLAFAGSLVVVGALAFAVLVLGVRSIADGRLSRLIVIAAATGVVGAVLALIAAVALTSGRDVFSALALVPDAATGSRFGRLGALRIVLATLVLAGSAAARVRQRAFAALVVLSLAFLVVPSFAGHAWTSSARALAVVADALHLVAVAVWIGGLTALIAVVPGSGAARSLTLKFSRVALVAVGVVTATGLTSAWLQVRSVDALTSTSYGKLLIVKVAGVAGLVAIGFVNRRRLVPLLERSAALFTAVRIELGLAALVIAVTAVLVNWVPGRDAFSRPFSATADATGGSVQLTLDPARVGQNALHLYFLTPEGLPRPVDAAEVTAAVGDVPARKLALQPVNASHFSSYGVALGTPGRWRITVTAVRNGSPTTTRFEVSIR